jgi:methyl-accepting chemotaxis protein
MKLNDISIRSAVKGYTVLAIVAFCGAVGWAEWALLSIAAPGGGIGPTRAATLLGALGVAGVLVLVAGGTALYRHITQRIDVLVARTEKLREGECDLTRRLPRMTGGLGRICAALNGFVERIEDLVTTVASHAGNIASSARGVSAGSAEVSERTSTQAATLMEAAASIEQFTASVKQNAENTQRARDLAAAASTSAQHGGRVAAEAVARIGSANESSSRIGTIVVAIDEIAFQTNILALNAAVEAARAGESGRGFAVVATEVGALAQRSADSAREAKSLVGDAMREVEDGARLVAEAGGAMDEIIAAIEGAAAIMNDIAAASSEQAAGIGQVNDAISELEDATRRNQAVVDRAAAAAQSMREQAEALAVLVSRFNVRDGAARGMLPRP